MTVVRCAWFAFKRTSHRPEFIKYGSCVDSFRFLFAVQVFFPVYARAYARPFLEGMVEGALFLIAKKEGDVRQAETCLLQIIDGRVLSGLIQNLLKTDTSFAQFTLQGALAQ